MSPGGGCNSVAGIVKHLRGNMMSRFTDFLTSDGEKSWRDRDAEFVVGRVSAAGVRGWWAEGWGVFRVAFDGLSEADVGREVLIRGEPHSVGLALMRALDHAAYHTGQLVWAAKLAVGEDRWETITVPVGGTAAHNRALGYDPGDAGGVGDGAG